MGDGEYSRDPKGNHILDNYIFIKKNLLSTSYFNYNEAHQYLQ